MTTDQLATLIQLALYRAGDGADDTKVGLALKEVADQLARLLGERADVLRRPELEGALKRSRALWDSMDWEEQEAELREQRKSWARQDRD